MVSPAYALDAVTGRSAVNYADRPHVAQVQARIGRPCFWPWHALDVGCGWSIPRRLVFSMWRNAGNFYRLARKYGYRISVRTCAQGMTIWRVR